MDGTLKSQLWHVQGHVVLSVYPCVERRSSRIPIAGDHRTQPIGQLVLVTDFGQFEIAVDLLQDRQPGSGRCWRLLMISLASPCKNSA